MKVFVGKRKNSNKKSKIKSIRSKILLCIISIALISAIVLGTVSSVLNYKASLETVEETLTGVSEIASDAIIENLNNLKTIAEELGQVSKFTEAGITTVEKDRLFNIRINKYGFLAAYMSDKNGNAHKVAGTNVNISEEEYFKKAVSGESFVSDMYFKDNGDMYFIVSAPLWNRGEYGTVVDGVIVIEVDGKVLSDIVSAIKVGEGGYGLIVDKNGYLIAHPDYQKVLKHETTAKDSGTSSASEADTYRNYDVDGVKTVLAHSPIENTNGWTVVIITPQSQYMVNTYVGIGFTVVLSVIIVIISIFIGTFLSKKIAAPVILSADRLKLLSEGDLHSEIANASGSDETAVLLDSLGKTVNVLKSVINDISYHLGKIVQGDYTTEVTLDYYGDLSPIKESLIKLIDFNNQQMRQIGESAEQIASGAEQVAAGAQVLSQGSTEQASSVEELAATINEITEQINSTADNAEKAKQAALDAGREIESGNSQVNEMNAAMDEITNASNEIAKIIKVIDDIAFQTNILALNAAVEAARAGSAGKGFAVVADEVRNLASKSAEAAKVTTALIENSLKSVATGSKIAANTKESLRLVSEKAFSAIEAIEEIAAASKEQALGASQISVGVDQISSVVQNNSATSEESAAASEELSSQAQLLKGMVDGIKLKDISAKQF